MNVDDLGDALSWLDTRLIDRLDDDWSRQTAGALERAGPRASDLMSELDAEARPRVLRAPEVTRRLLFPASAPGDTAEFLARAASVEMFLAGLSPPPPVSSWSALGDVLVRPDGTVSWWPQLPQPGVPLDFGSPWAQHVDLTGRREYADTERRQFAGAEMRGIHGRLCAAVASVAEMSTAVDAFVRRATCVLVLQIDPAAPAQVASGTNGHYIGRSFLTNPHSPEATVECLAEAIVHEAIHGLLYRESLRRPWVSGDAAREIPCVESPWTGRLLPVRAFLEASCVWFGLVHMWALACQAGTFDAEISRDRLQRSIRGFGYGSLADRVAPWRGEVRADVVETVDGLQQRILEALVGTP